MSLQPSLAQQYERKRDDRVLPDLWHSRQNRCKPHFHASIELVYVTEGELTVFLDDQQHVVRKNQLMIASAYTVHRYQSDRDNAEVILIIPLSFVPSLQKTLRDHAFSQTVYDLSGDPRTKTILDMMAEGWTDFNIETKKGLCYTLLGLLLSRVGLAAQNSSTRSTQMKDMLIYLQENYQSTLSMEEMAKRFGYSKSRFSRLFHDYLGCSMNEYLMAQRCRHAAELLMDSELTMLEIATDVGFECLRTFYRAFHTCYQCTPSQYVKNHTR